VTRTALVNSKSGNRVRLKIIQQPWEVSDNKGSAGVGATTAGTSHGLGEFRLVESGVESLFRVPAWLYGRTDNLDVGSPFSA